MNVGGLIRDDACACASSSESVAFDTHLAYPQTCALYAHDSRTLAQQPLRTPHRDEPAHMPGGRGAAGGALRRRRPAALGPA
ncbi:unnamed protein product, partial [Brenthis ino]